MRDKPIQFATGLVVAGSGAVWILQGFGASFAPQSFMTDNRMWVLWGALAVLIGLTLIRRSHSR